MTMRYTGGGHKQRYRIIDFKEQRKEFLRQWSQLNMIQIVLHLSHC
jgi:ribosomal protein L2